MLASKETSSRFHRKHQSGKLSITKTISRLSISVAHCLCFSIDPERKTKFNILLYICTHFRVTRRTVLTSGEIVHTLTGKKSSAPCHLLWNRRRGVVVQIELRPEICSFLCHSQSCDSYINQRLVFYSCRHPKNKVFTTSTLKWFIFSIRYFSFSLRPQIDWCLAICSIVSPDTKFNTVARSEVKKKKQQQSDPTITYQF